MTTHASNPTRGLAKKSPKPMTEVALPCPCGKGAAYLACCARWHAGEQAMRAPDAETLMRSRYSAFVFDRLDYLLATWHPSTRPAGLLPNPPGLKWLGLTVQKHVVEDECHATVAFVACHRLQGRAHRLKETSRFVRENGQWLYVDGDIAD